MASHQCRLRRLEAHVPEQLHHKVEMRAPVGVVLLHDNNEVDDGIGPAARAAAVTTCVDGGIKAIADDCYKLALRERRHVAQASCNTSRGQHPRDRAEVDELIGVAVFTAELLEQLDVNGRSLHPHALRRGCSADGPGRGGGRENACHDAGVEPQQAQRKETAWPNLSKLSWERRGGPLGYQHGPRMLETTRQSRKR